MTFKRLICRVLLFALLLGTLTANAERPAPSIVGANSYPPRPDEIHINPVSYTELKRCMQVLPGATLGDYVDKLSPTSYSWSGDGVVYPKTVITLNGEMGQINLIMDESPFGPLSGNDVASTLYNRIKVGTVSEISKIVWKTDGFIDYPRGIGIGSTLDNVLNAFGITQIQQNGLIYDNDIVYADEGSEESDYADHPIIAARIYVNSVGNTVMEFLAYEGHASNYCLLTYLFTGEKISAITLVNKA